MYETDLMTPICPMTYGDGSNTFYIKRDDLLPFSFGGNKVRIAHEYFNDMQKKGYDCIIGYGDGRSNLSRVIANMSRSLGIPCYIVSPTDHDEEDWESVAISSNEMLVKLMNATVVHCARNNVAETVEFVIKKCRKDGLNPYYINGDKYGKGNEKVPVNAYVKAYDEILSYERVSGKNFDYIFHASGTGTTQAGLVCGKRINADMKKIVGISIARDHERGYAAIENNIDAFLGDDSFNIESSDIYFDDSYICGGYGKYNDHIISIVREILSTDGVPLDYTYTGKAFWGMTEYIKNHQIKGKNILFLHTGGTPLFFDNLLGRG